MRLGENGEGFGGGRTERSGASDSKVLGMVLGTGIVLMGVLQGCLPGLKQVKPSGDGGNLPGIGAKVSEIKKAPVVPSKLQAVQSNGVEKVNALENLKLDWLSLAADCEILMGSFESALGYGAVATYRDMKEQAGSSVEAAAGYVFELIGTIINYSKTALRSNADKASKVIFADSVKSVGPLVQKVCGLAMKMPVKNQAVVQFLQSHCGGKGLSVSR